MANTKRDEVGREVAHAHAVKQLTEHPGWAVFVQAAIQVVLVAKQQAATAETAHQMAFHTGAALTVEQLLDWPRRELDRIRAEAGMRLDSQE